MPAGHVLASLIAVLASLAGASSAHAALQTIPGDPVRVFVADSGQLQARFTDPSQGSLSGFFVSGDTGSSSFWLRFLDGPLAGQTHGSRGGTTFTSR